MRTLSVICLMVLLAGCASLKPEDAPFYGSKNFEQVAGRPPAEGKEADDATRCRLDANARYPRGGDETTFAVIGGIEKILAHLGLATVPRPPGPAPPAGAAVIAQP